LKVSDLIKFQGFISDIGFLSGLRSNQIDSNQISSYPVKFNQITSNTKWIYIKLRCVYIKSKCIYIRLGMY